MKTLKEIQNKVKKEFEGDLCVDCKADSEHEIKNCGQEGALINPYRVKFLLDRAIFQTAEATMEAVRGEKIKETFDGSKRTWQDGFVTGKQLTHNQAISDQEKKYKQFIGKE